MGLCVRFARFARGCDEFHFALVQTKLESGGITVRIQQPLDRRTQRGETRL